MKIHRNIVRDPRFTDTPAFEKRILSCVLAFSLLASSAPVSAGVDPSNLPDRISGDSGGKSASGAFYSLRGEMLFQEIFQKRPPLSQREQMKLLEKFLKDQGLKISRKNRRALLDYTRADSGDLNNITPVIEEKNVRLEIDRQGETVTIRRKVRGGEQTQTVQIGDIRRVLRVTPGKGQVKLLRELFRETGVHISDEKTLKRILRDYHKSRENEPANLLGESRGGRMVLSSELSRFVQAVRENYEFKLTGRERRALDLLDQILLRDHITDRDIFLFRRILTELGIPSHLHEDKFLRGFLLMDLRMEEAQRLAKTAVLSDKNALKLLEKIKEKINAFHYSSIQPRPGLGNLFKSFSIQFVMFQMVLGSHIFKDYVLDYFFYDAPRNPDPLGLALQQFGPGAAFAFGSFFASYLLTERAFFKLGNRWNSPFLRSIGSPAGLVVSYILALVVGEAYQDRDIFAECVRSLTGGAGEEGNYIGSCERAYLKWWNSNNWTYLIDGVSILFSAVLSNKIVQWGSALIRASPRGSTFFYRLFPMGGWFGPVTVFAFTLSVFIEIQQLTDEYAVKPIKGWVQSHGSQEAVAHLDSTTSLFLNKRRELWESLRAVPVNNLKTDETALQNFKAFLQTGQQPSQDGDLLRDFIASLHREELKQLNNLPQDSRFFQAFSDSSFGWGAGLTDSETDILFYQTLMNFIDPAEREALLKILHDMTVYRHSAISKIKHTGFQFSQWFKVRGEPFAQAFYLWKQKTDKTTSTYAGAEELLTQLYSQSEDLSRLTDQMQKELTETDKEKEDALGWQLDPEEEIIATHQFKTRKIKQSYDQRLRDRMDFFTFSYKHFDEDRRFYRHSVCRFLIENPEVTAVLLEQRRFFPQQNGWVEWCENPKETYIEGGFMIYQTLPILNALLKQRFPDIFNPPEETGTVINSYLSVIPDKLFADSRDQTGALFLHDASVEEKARIASAFATAAYSFTTAPPVSATAWGNMKRFACAVKYAEGRFTAETVEDCESSGETAQYAVKILRDKMTAVAVQIFKEILNQAPFSLYRDGPPLLGFVEVHGSGEKWFAELESYAKQDSQFPSPYTFMDDFICGPAEGKVSGDGRFSPPQMFSGFSFLCDELDTINKDDFPALRKFWFQAPVTTPGGARYFSLYEGITTQIKDLFSAKEDPLNTFQSRSRQTIRSATERIVSELRNLEANYIIPGLTNDSDRVKGITQCQAVADYYTIQNNRDFKGLEIHLFQVNFWLNHIRAFQYGGTGADFSDLSVAGPSADFDRASCKVLELLKNYHDAYIQGVPLRYLTLEEAREIRNKDFESAFGEISGREAFTLLPPSLILSLILKASYPEWDSDYLSFDERHNRSAGNERESLEHSLVTELKRSIDGFYLSLKLLHLQESVEKTVNSEESGTRSLYDSLTY